MALRILNKFNAFEKFVVVWTVSNYFALKSIEEYQGMLLVYEQLLSDPENTIQKLNDYMGFEIENIPDIYSDNFYKFDPNLLAKLHRTISKYSLETEFEYIVETVKKQNIYWKL